jgi:hypothetical protein
MIQPDRPSQSVVKVKACEFRLVEQQAQPYVSKSLPSQLEPLRSALGEALRLAAAASRGGEREESQDGEGEMVVVCGTAFIMSDIRSLLGLQEPRDEDI